MKYFHVFTHSEKKSHVTRELRTSVALCGVFTGGHVEADWTYRGFMNHWSSCWRCKRALAKEAMGLEEGAASPQRTMQHGCSGEDVQ